MLAIIEFAIFALRYPLNLVVFGHFFPYTMTLQCDMGQSWPFTLSQSPHSISVVVRVCAPWSQQQCDVKGGHAYTPPPPLSKPLSPSTRTTFLLSKKKNQCCQIENPEIRHSEPKLSHFTRHQMVKFKPFLSHF